jgi:hypothetical protein
MYQKLKTKKQDTLKNVPALFKKSDYFFDF